MNKTLIRLFFVCLVMALLGQTEKTSVAIYQIKAAGVEPSLPAAMTMLLSSELTPSPRLRVIEEAMLKTVMERQGLNASDACDDSSCQVEVGKLVKAQKIITGGLAKLGNKYIMSLQLVDVQSGATEFSTKDECSCSEDQLDKLIAVAAAKVRNHFGESLPVPQLQQAQAVPTNNPNVGAQLAAPGTGRASPAPTNQQFQEFHPPGTKGGPMVFVSDFKFYIDKFEVTNQDFQECVSARVCKKAEQKGGLDAPRQPVVFVNQHDARTYCKWAGKRLPNQKEWQEAAQGTDSRTYPWGNQEPNCILANYQGCASGTVSVGSKPAGASPYGALDMAGNVWEWVEEKGVLRGGGWGPHATSLRVVDPGWLFASKQYDDVGFRCARDGSP